MIASPLDRCIYPVKSFDAEQQSRGARQPGFRELHPESEMAEACSASLPGARQIEAENLPELLGDLLAGHGAVPQRLERPQDDQ